jgi:hypothetical protein
MKHQIADIENILTEYMEIINDSFIDISIELKRNTELDKESIDSLRKQLSAAEKRIKKISYCLRFIRKFKKAIQ